MGGKAKEWLCQQSRSIGCTWASGQLHLAFLDIKRDDAESNANGSTMCLLCNGHFPHNKFFFVYLIIVRGLLCLPVNINCIGIAASCSYISERALLEGSRQNLKCFF